MHYRDPEHSWLCRLGCKFDGLENTNVTIIVVLPKRCEFDVELAGYSFDYFSCCFATQLGEGYYNAVNVVQTFVHGYEFVTYWGFLDDLQIYVDPVAVKQAVNIFPISMIADDGHVVREWPEYEDYLKAPYLIPHLGSWFPVKFFSHLYNETFKVSGDLDWIVRGCKAQPVKIIFDDSFMIFMAPGGLSRSWPLLALRLYEQWKCHKHLGYRGSLCLIQNLIKKLRQVKW